MAEEQQTPVETTDETVNPKSMNTCIMFPSCVSTARFPAAGLAMISTLCLSFFFDSVKIISLLNCFYRPLRGSKKASFPQPE